MARNDVPEDGFAARLRDARNDVEWAMRAYERGDEDMALFYLSELGFHAAKAAHALGAERDGRVAR